MHGLQEQGVISSSLHPAEVCGEALVGPSQAPHPQTPTSVWRPAPSTGFEGKSVKQMST